MSVIPNQSDRDAAAQLYLDLEGPPFSPRDLAEAESHRRGDYDEHPSIVAFARHRLAAERETIERCARVADACAAEPAVPQIDYDIACRDVAYAIRATKEPENDAR